MKITNFNAIQFKSLNHPIKPFKLNVLPDEISFAEIDYSKMLTKGELRKIIEFLVDNLIETSNQPVWKFCKKNSSMFNEAVYNFFVEIKLMPQIREKLKNPDTTLLLGKDKNKKIVASLFANPLKMGNTIKEDDILYIDMMAIDKRYRKNHMGSKMLGKVYEATKGRYDKSIVVSNKKVEDFYKKCGYQKLNDGDIFEKDLKIKLSDYWEGDYPQYVSFLKKELI